MVKSFFSSALMLLVLTAHADEWVFEKNLEWSSIDNRQSSLYWEKKINDSSFLPTLSLNTGLGSEKMLDESAQKRGPYLYLEGKINLYNGGINANLQRLKQEEWQVASLEKELAARKVKIEAFKIALEFEFLKKDQLLIEAEFAHNKNEEQMAKKKVDAGLTGPADLLDFELKNEYLAGELENALMKQEQLEKDLASLLGEKIPFEEVRRKLPTPAEETVDLEKLPESLLAQKHRALAKIELKNIQSEYLPTVDVEGKWGHLTFAEHFLKEREHQIAINLKIPLFSGFDTAYRSQKAILNSTQKESEWRQVSLDLKARQDFELKKIERLKKLLKVVEKSLGNAVKYKNLTMAEYKRGIKNSPDVLSASDKNFELKRKINELNKDIEVSIFSYRESFKPFQGGPGDIHGI